jgi:hypothetical protein
MNCDTDLIDRDLNEPSHAWKHVPHLDGSFPLLVYIPSISGSPFQNYILIEYLVSHGYIVASFPSVGANSRTMTLDRSGIETQVDDLKFVLNKMHDFPNIDFDKIGLIGFSLGGLTKGKPISQTEIDSHGWGFEIPHSPHLITPVIASKSTIYMHSCNLGLHSQVKSE